MSSGRIHVEGKKTRVLRGKHPLALVPLLFLLICGILFTLHASPFNHLVSARGNGLTQLNGHVPALIKKSTLLGPTDPNTPVELLIGLHPRNEANLKSYVDTLSRTHSTTGHRYLKPSQIAAAFAPLSSSQSAIIAYMQQAGFSENETFTHQLLIGFTGTIGEAENAFYVQINNYRAPGGREFYAPSSNPSVPVGLAPFIQSITGLDDARVYTHPPIVATRHASSSNAATSSANCMAAQAGPPFSYYVPNQIASAYNLSGLYNAGFHGEGQTVALYELDNYVSSDVSVYTKCFGVSSVPINRIAVNGGAPTTPGQGAIEVELDMELVLSSAPHLASLRVYEAANDSVDALAEW
ncbi:MAG TPA: protease pro-enzyme activation domain-containing protein, partial [Ktedonobacteraceae bacterium]|nr:protease pro-enzyme activation domain-containing protein [Ktedonobacteraceae bacterium]